MPSVELDDQEWQAVMAIVATAPWRDANPLLMKIGGQLRNQAGVMPPPAQQGTPETLKSAVARMKESK